MKTFLVFLILSFAFTAIANDIVCSGQKTEASMVLDMSTMANFQPGVYSYNGKVIPSSGYQFGTTSNTEVKSQVLLYKFKVLKKHALAAKNSNLVLSIKQNYLDSDPFSFVLNKTNAAELGLEVDGVITLLDNMDCI